MKHVIRAAKPGRKWEDGFPMGNGRLGMMIPGKIDEETIFINEETLWYGKEQARTNAAASGQIDKIRRLLLDGKLDEAAFLAKMSMTGTPKYNNPYQPAGDLRLCFQGIHGKPDFYERILDIDRAVTTVTYRFDDTEYERTMFVSMEYQVAAIRLISKGKAMTMCANMNRKPMEENTGALNEKTVGNWGTNGHQGMQYFTGVRMWADTKAKVMGDFVYAKDANEIWIFVASQTDFGGNNGFRESCMEQLDRAEAAGFDEILRKHLLDYKRLYDNMSLTISEDSECSQKMTADMMAALKNGDETDLLYLQETMFAFARYLMISSSYQCQMPSNLQGLWNGSYEPPWQSQYTININTQMNYWFVEKSGLSECHLPLFALLERMAEKGKKTAKDMYGCRGFVAHHNTNVWAVTDPEGIFAASPFWNMGGAWLSLHMYEHFLYTQDRTFLKERALPVMREAIRFFEDYLYRAEEGLWLTGPSVSPENSYRLPNGEQGALCMAPTMDSMILRQLCQEYLEGIAILGESGDEADKVAELLSHLPQTKLTKDGRICEWYLDYEEVEPGHRHISHLFGLHPGHEITKETPELFEAAAKTVDARLASGGGHTGWSKAWVCCFYARLGNGEKTGQHMREMLQRSILDNLLDVHPPFQIDGNFGLAEAMLECLVQSHTDVIELLPALPSQWKDGSLKQVRLRKGLTADIEWKDGTLVYASLISAKDQTVRVRYHGSEKAVNLTAGVKITL